MAKRRETSRWARLSSWIVGAAVWLWIVYRFIVQDLPGTSSVIDASGELLLDGLFFVVAATVVAALALFLVRVIGRATAWLKLRF